MGIIWDKKTLYYFTLIGELGLIFILNILIFVYIYKWIFIKILEENTIVFIMFLLSGIISGGISVYKLILQK